ncbi:exonuclease domain-containing protein [Intrasporangium chromatireducens]|uniref:exonuclease domain-containing protein n=1 Tax=Intrasporangium chromatireducens TaxID=1386088 RepID=UPI001969AF34|nr:exonuclease domain-containing protein [Intrasporangium chromatireducens]
MPLDEDLETGGTRSVSGYTVIDVETTGLFPEKHDRIVEIAVVYVSDQGDIRDHWSTLVNPQRDVGPTRIHGISSTDVLDAPTFRQVAPYILRAVEGRTIVAHNATFDLRFLAHEFIRSGIPLENLPLHGVCTMQWSTSFINGASRRLVDCCNACGLPLENAHSAAGDALATAGLLAYFLNMSDFKPPWFERLHSTRGYTWPPFPGVYPELRIFGRRQARDVPQDQWLDRIVSRMPRAADPRVDGYLAVLETALVDRFLAEHEKDQLINVALESGLTRGQVIDLHADYLRAMAEVALDDGVVTEDERADLERVAAMLGLANGDVNMALELAAEPEHGRHRAGSAVATSGLKLSPGDRVCFTGEMGRPRSAWEQAVERKGLSCGGLTKSTAILVAADPNSLSGKAEKARRYGIPVVTEDAFEKLLSQVAP